MGSLLLLVLLRLMMAMSLGWGSGAPLTFPCVGGGIVRSKGSSEKTHPRKNSVSGSCVEASVVEAPCGARMGASSG